MVYKFFDKITSGGAATLAWSETLRLETLAIRTTRNKSVLKFKNMSNKELAEELQKPIIRIFKKRKVQQSFIDNILGADLADIQLISKFDKGIPFLLCVIDIFS